MNNFYVYMYKHPVSNEIFYIGKGKDGRMFDHLRDAKMTSHNRYVLQKIRKILKEYNMEPIIEVHTDNLSETESFILEKTLIKSIGRKDLGLGPLCNITDGGEGSSGHISPKKGKTYKEYFGEEKAIEISNKISIAQKNRSEDIARLNKIIHTGKIISEEVKEKTKATLKSTIQSRPPEKKAIVSENIRRSKIGVKPTYSEETRKSVNAKLKEHMTDLIHINDGVNNRRIPISDLDEYIKAGWQRGYITRKKRECKNDYLPASAKKCVIDGVTYNTIKSACEATGLSAYYIHRIINGSYEYKNGEFLYSQGDEYEIPSINNGAIPCKVNGISYTSIKEAARTLGLSVYRVKTHPTYEKIDH